MDNRSPYKGRTGLDRIARAVGHSLDGLSIAYRTESAFRQELWAAAVLVPVAFGLGRGWLETAVPVASVMAVLVVELINSAIEHAVDRVSFETHVLSKHAKDLASAAVMLSLLTCAAVWLAALWNRLVA